ncbi:helix-turn-helix domain-containing protein [Pseudomonas sp. S30_BP2TU TE3576]|uniref:helix-turn-helix domain-containing protein n=1 Tax=Pseudomonas sp. S30_BP2TU TE3576 TaxID=3349329 RepID=UPI003D1BA8C7
MPSRRGCVRLRSSRKTLQRRLKDDGCAFNDVRRDLVLRYLDNPNYSLSRIADMLGYSMANSFTRWFIHQFGMPPATWRAQKLGAAKVQVDAAGQVVPKES